MELLLTERFHNGSLAGKKAEILRSGDSKPATLWFAVPTEFEFMITTDDQFLLPFLLHLHMVWKEQIRWKDAEFDAAFYRNCLAACAQFRAWYKSLNPLGFSTPVTCIPRKANQRPRSVASLYSGGIDFLFTLTRHNSAVGDAGTRAVDRPISFAVHVFYLQSADQYVELAGSESGLRDACEQLGATFVPIYTNSMFFSDQLRAWWGRLVQSASMATAFHFLGGGIDTGLIGSSHSYGHLIPWGSSPVIDPLYSSSDLAIVHDGSTFTRVEKTGAIAQSEAALSVINVCDNLVPGHGYRNCSRCQKCLRTMITLDLFDSTGDRCPAFDWSSYKTEDYGKAFLRDDSEATFALEIAEASREKRPDIYATCLHALRRSSLLSWLAHLEEFAVRNSPFVRRNRIAAKKLKTWLYTAVDLR